MVIKTIGFLRLPTGQPGFSIGGFAGYPRRR
jgi:hypothetical protein